MPRIFTAALLLGLLASSSYAQHNALIELYGEGVHRYFENDVMAADQLLTTVVDSGSQDPRVYYFRGLARERLGMDGLADFQTGARLEAEGRSGSFEVGTALARIQGSLRGKIEAARRDARIVVSQQQLSAAQARQPVQPATGSAPPAPSLASPFPSDTIPANDAGLSAPPAAAVPAAQPPAPAAPSVGDTSDPFADDAPAVPPADTAPAEAPPAEAAPEVAPADAADPFGAPAGDMPNPFGEPAPAGGEAAPASDNPFGL